MGYVERERERGEKSSVFIPERRRHAALSCARTHASDAVNAAHAASTIFFVDHLIT